MSVRRYNIEAQARFLTFSCYQRVQLLDDPDVRNLLIEQIEAQRRSLGFRVIAWVIMPEHVHLLLVPKDGEIAPVLKGIKMGFARRVLTKMRKDQNPLLEKMRDARGVAHIWQRGGGYDRNVRDQAELEKFVGYIHMNPVKRGLVEQATDWVWSSARDYQGVQGKIELWRG
ncbi:hypothetical protein COB72_04625 [bacterium]|nr:MAG: hypothetical protein COB72_04625 [bacterium]